MTQLDIDPNQPWSKCRFELFLDQLCELSSSDALRIIGVDGHSGSGKSSLASSLAAIDRDVAVVHTDDLAWHHSFFDWDQLLVDRILSPLRRYGPAVTYQPQPWVDRGRPGAITVPATAKVVIVEGVGACRRELQPWFDATVWVHAQPEVALRRAIAKGADTQQFIDDWMAQENAFMSDQQPWTRADMLVSGALGQPSLTGKYGNIVTALGAQWRMER